MTTSRYSFHLDNSVMIGAEFEIDLIDGEWWARQSAEQDVPAQGRADSRDGAVLALIADRLGMLAPPTDDQDGEAHWEVHQNLGAPVDVFARDETWRDLENAVALECGAAGGATLSPTQARTLARALDAAADRAERMRQAPSETP